MHKIEGHEGLVKDPRSTAVVNVDDNAFKRAKKMKQRILQEKQKNKELESRVEHLEHLIQTILKDNEHG